MPILKFFRKHQDFIFFSAILLMVTSLPLSRFGLSVAQFTLLGIWLLGDNLISRIRQFFNNRAALVLVSFYLLHLLGLIYTSDFSYAMKDLRVKLPLLFLPIVFSSFRFPDKKKTDIVFLIYIAAVLVASFISLGILLFGHYSDFRELSPFISHIRLSLNVCLAIFFAIYYIFYGYERMTAFRWILVLTAIWLGIFLVLIESVTGVLILLVVGLMLLGYAAFKTKSLIRKISLIGLFVFIPLSLSIYLQSTIHSYLTSSEDLSSHLDSLTAKGNVYTHDTTNQPIEVGSYIGLYVCEMELRTQWNQISSFDYDGKDARDQLLKYTLIRYLNSLHLRKDASGVNQLTALDIQNIEQGIANVYYAKKFCVNARIYRLLWEYQIKQRDGNPGGHTLIQRLEFWKTSMEIIRHNPIIGVGSGDIDQAFSKAYEQLDSPLGQEWRHRSHNQFLAICVSFGLIGGLWFLVSLFYPGIHLRKFISFRYFVFFTVLFISMLVEDTLETQMGVTLFAFFNSFLLFGINKD